jgi:hypothetical protein
MYHPPSYRIPPLAASGLEARYRAEAKGRYGDRALIQGEEWMRLAPGEEVTLSVAGRIDRMAVVIDRRTDFSIIMNGILYAEGVEEAKDTAPCSDRANSKTGCAFAEVSKFNIGLDIVYFQDGTIWGNYGYGYAVPNPDGMFTRVDGQFCKHFSNSPFFLEMWEFAPRTLLEPYASHNAIFHISGYNPGSYEPRRPQHDARKGSPSDRSPEDSTPRDGNHRAFGRAVFRRPHRAG